MTKKNSIVRTILVAELFLVLPLIGTLFSSQVDWDMFDFIIGAILLAGLGTAYSLVVNSKDSSGRAVVGILSIALLLLLWAELAVGIFGSPMAGS